MRFRLIAFTNVLLLAATAILTLTGVYGLFWTLNGWMFAVHRAAGWALIAALPWKMGISLRSLRRGVRPGFERGVMIAVALILSALTALVLALGLAWSWRLGPEELWLRQTAISWHWMLALALLAPFALHAWRRWPGPRKADLLSRRAALKLAGVTGASLAGFWAAEALAAFRQLALAPRRFTGSRRAGEFSGNSFPVTHSMAAGEIDPHAWRLVLEGAVSGPQALTYDELRALPASEQAATLDCTLGWYTLQNWQGVPLRDLLERVGAAPESFAVRLESVTGYAHILPMAEAKEILLATHVGDEVLEHLHGFPLRAVVPTRRGWFWVKWLSRVEVIAL
jgi:hypothetical protein